MAIHPLVAAKRVCELRDWTATNLEINKVLFIAHMVLLGRTDGRRRLVSEPFEAWDYGPVLPTVYHRAKAFGNGPVQNVFTQWPSLHVGVEADVIRETLDSVSDKSPGDLVAITHWEHGAWANNYVPGAKGVVIPDSDILREYRKRGE